MACQTSPLIRCMQTVAERLDLTEVVPYFLANGHLKLVEVGKFKPYHMIDYGRNLEFIELLERKGLSEQIFIDALEYSNQGNIAREIKSAVKQLNEGGGSAKENERKPAFKKVEVTETEMNENHKKVLNKVRIFFNENLGNFSVLGIFLLSNEALSSTQFERLQKMSKSEGNIDVNNELLNMLTENGHRVYDILLKGLRDRSVNKSFIAAQIERIEKELSQS